MQAVIWLNRNKFIIHITNQRLFRSTSCGVVHWMQKLKKDSLACLVYCQEFCLSNLPFSLHSTSFIMNALKQLTDGSHLTNILWTIKLMGAILTNTLQTLELMRDTLTNYTTLLTTLPQTLCIMRLMGDISKTILCTQELKTPSKPSCERKARWKHSPQQ